MKKILLFFLFQSAVLFLAASLYSCVSCESEELNDEYWESVAYEKGLRKMGLTARADIERDIRLDKRKRGQYKKTKEDKIREKKKNEPYVINKVNYRIKSDEHIFLYDTINGNKIINEKATQYYGKTAYRRLSKLDRVYVIQEKDGWVKVSHVEFQVTVGWIEKKYLGEKYESYTLGSVMEEAKRTY